MGGTCVARDPVSECLNITAASSGTGHVLGGLCPGGQGNLDADPTGEFGCTYSYGHVAQLSLDGIVGILGEDCGGRLCADWLDFRLHCSNEAYRRKFDVASGTIVWFKYCTEYDIHPACSADCSKEECQGLPEEERELGLPFWRGRCNAQANEGRSELFASAVGEHTATTSHDVVGGSLDIETTCIDETPGLCTPLKGHGGNYCTRQWAGVCLNCFIPGTKFKWSADHMPYCPYDVLQLSDYRGRFPEPVCKSSLPRDLCCLYTGSCTIHATDAATAPLDEDGFAIVASWKNTTAMAVFLQRSAAVSGLDMSPAAVDALQGFAYSRWSHNPRKGGSLEWAIEDMVSEGIASFIRTSTLTATSTTATSATATSTTLTSSSTTTPLSSRVEIKDQDWSSSLWSSCEAVVVACLAMAASFVVIWSCGRCSRSKKEGKGLPSAASQVRDPEVPEVPEAF